MLKNMMLRRKVGPKQNEELHNEELRDMCSSQNIIRTTMSRRMRWAGHVATCLSYWWGNQKGRGYKEDQGRWVDNIEMDLGEVGCGDVDWISLAQDRDRWRALMNVAMNLGFHKMLGGSQGISQLVASRVVLSSVDLVVNGWSHNLRGFKSVSEPC
jgi:hypothetical protein